MTANQIFAAIDDVRKKSGLSLEELAKRSGVSFSAIKGWFAGTATPRLDKLMNVMGVLGMSLAYTANEKTNPCARCGKRRFCMSRCSLRIAYDASWLVERCQEG